MDMKSVSMQELKLTLSTQIAYVEAGDQILITRHGRPVARLAPLGNAGCRVGAEFMQRAITPVVRGGVGGRSLEILAEDRHDRLGDRI